LANLEEMETDSSQSSPSPSPKSTNRRSPSRGTTSGNNQTTKSNPPQSPQGAQNQDPKKDSRGTENAVLHPLHDAWNAYGGEVMEAPAPSPQVPPDKTQKKDHDPIKLDRKK
jgi:hypothetical protein